MQRTAHIPILTTLLFSTAAWAGSPRVAEKKCLTLEGAKSVVAAAVAEAVKLNAPGGAIAVVDDAGHLLYFERLTGTFTASWSISIGKARTAAMFKKPTSAFEEIIKGGRTPMLALNDFTPLQGGVPIVQGGQVVGAIGVSGAASAQQDEEIALAGAAAVSADDAKSASVPSAPVTHVPGDRVNDAFEKGGVLVDGGVAQRYMVHASRRDAPGLAEVHMDDTDIFHVITGSATLVTGGQLVEPVSESAEGEIRAPAIRDGESLRLGKGDVIVIPKGTPHWFRDVREPITYYVVKVR